MSVNTISQDEFAGRMNRFVVKNQARIASDIFQASETAKYCTTIMNAKGEYQMAESRMERLTQPFQKKWTPKGNPSFHPVTIQVRRCKVDTELYVDEIHDKWLGHLHSEKLTPKQMPITRYFMQYMLLPQIQEDREEVMVYDGVYKEPTAGTAGDTIDCYDGLGTVMNRHIVEGRISPIPLGAINSGNMFEKTEEYYDFLPLKWKKKGLNVFMSFTNKLNHHRDRRADYGGNTNYNPTVQNNYIDFTNFRMVDLASMANKQRLWGTPKWNMIRLICQREIERQVTIRVEEQDRLLKMWLDWYEGYGFAIPELVFCSDGDLA